MKTSDRGVDFIKDYEGFSAMPYICSGGKLTIGYGHTAAVTPEMRVTEAEAIELLRSDLGAAERTVNRLVKRNLTQNQYDAIVSLVYNIGAGRFKESELLEKLNAMDDAGVLAEFPKWRKANGKVSRGLIRRRKAEAAMFAELPWSSDSVHYPTHS